MNVAHMAVGGRLVLKGGLKVTKTGVEKKKKHKKKKKKSGEETDGGQEGEGSVGAPHQKSYEDEFFLEMEKAKKGHAKDTPWGQGYKKAPKILHGYTAAVKGNTAEERLDMRAAMKSDKFCK